MNCRALVELVFLPSLKNTTKQDCKSQMKIYVVVLFFFIFCNIIHWHIKCYIFFIFYNVWNSLPLSLLKSSSIIRASNFNMYMKIALKKRLNVQVINSWILVHLYQLILHLYTHTNNENFAGSVFHVESFTSCSILQFEQPS